MVFKFLFTKTGFPTCSAGDIELGQTLGKVSISIQARIININSIRNPKNQVQSTTSLIFTEKDYTIKGPLPTFEYLDLVDITTSHVFMYFHFFFMLM